MNNDATELIATWSKGYTLDHETDGCGDLAGMLRAAMEWAYRDAAKFVKDTDWICNDIGDDYADRIADAIEARLK